ncbi:Lsr2 family protein [Actinoplanes lobatus]|uniref:Uncharacterized protein n=1 Tax=Actinoplanes lobatus TaxID=113568 RepID=A0A7W7HEQ0_9ACTN|nr:Lsr2 family protein [Actinoplanes lobatus]MBB4749157.1 hypothetical protein [Actinoplanes lobatus]
MTDTIVMAGYPVGHDAAQILAMWGLGRTFADICRDTQQQDPITVTRTLGAAGYQRGRAAQMALAWQHKTGHSLVDALRVKRIAPPPSASNDELRAWADGRGIPVSRHGRVPAYVRVAHERAMAEDLRVP